DALALQLLDRRVGVEARRRDALVGGERRVRGGGAGPRPGAEVVVGHHVVPVDVLGGAGVVGRVDLAARGAVGGDRGGDQVVVAEPGAQRGHEVPERLRAAGVTGQAAGVRVLPVDVDAVEHVRPPRVRQQPVAGVGERLRVLRGLGEPAGVGPAAEREQHLDVRVLLLQLAELVEAAAQRPLVPGVGHAVDALVRAVEPVVRRVRVGDHALAVDHVAEGVVDVAELGGRAAGVDVLDVVVALVDAPVDEVAEHLLAAAVAAAGLGGGAHLVARLGDVARGVPGPHGVGVGGRRAEAGDGVAGLGDGGDAVAVAVGLLPGYAGAVVGRGPGDGGA